MFYNSAFLPQKVVSQLLKTSYLANHSFRNNLFSTIGRFRNSDTFLGVKRQDTTAIECINKTLTSFYSTGVCNSEDKLKSSYKNDVNEQPNRETLFKEISNGDLEIEKKLKVIEYELSVFGESTDNPFIHTEKEDWEILLKKPGFPSRQKYIRFLWKRTRSNEKKRKKKEKRWQEYLMKKEEMGEEEDVNQYKLSQNSMFIRIYEKTLARMMNLRLIDALSFSQHIVFDCSYESYMSQFNAKFCAKQLASAYAENRIHQAPFHVKLCNVNKNDYSMKTLSKIIPGFFSETFLWDVHEESYLDLYPKERLVYLTPHAKQELFEYNHEDIYIIGAFVDRGTGQKVSLAKAKENNLRMAKLPLDFFIDWKKGMKSLSINHVMSIMLDMRLFNDWRVAFKNVPSRFGQPL